MKKVIINRKQIDEINLNDAHETKVTVSSQNLTDAQTTANAVKSMIPNASVGMKSSNPNSTDMNNTEISSDNNSYNQSIFNRGGIVNKKNLEEARLSCMRKNGVITTKGELRKYISL